MSYSTFNSIAIAGIATSIPSNKMKFEGADGKANYVHKASEFQTTSDFGYTAAKYILDEKQIPLEEIGVLVFASKTPDYRGPASAAVLQGRLNFSKDCIAFDINVGSSGFIHGSQIVCANLESVNKKYGLLIVGDTTTKQLENDNDLTVNFGDGASAILFEKEVETTSIYMNTKTYSNDYKSYMISRGGFRKKLQTVGQENNNFRSIENNFLEIDENQFLNFTTTEIPEAINSFLEHFKIESTAYDFLALHQFNSKSIDVLCEKLKINFKEIPVNYSSYGNTCGNSIPLLLTDNFGKNKESEKRILACAYGEGFSLGVMDFTIKTDAIFEIIESNAYYEEGFISHKA